MSDHLRGLFVSLCLLIVVCAFVSGTAAGSEIAATSTAELRTPSAVDETPVYTVDDVDRNLSSGATYWQGQTAGFVDPNQSLSTDRLHLREYDEASNSLGPLVGVVEISDTGQIDTTDLDGTYVLVLPDSRTTAVVVEDGTVSGTTDLDSVDPFEVLVQTLDVRWRGSAGSNGTVSTDLKLELRSNRARYNVNLTAPNRTFAELESAFIGDRLLRDWNAPHSDRPPLTSQAGDYETYATDDVIVVRGFKDGFLRSDFSGAGSLPRAVTVEVTDTGVTDTAEISAPDVETGPFEITNIVAPGSVEPGSPIDLSATVRNRWRVTDQRDVTFELADGSRTTVTTSLRDRASTTVSTTFVAPDEPGEYEYTVDTDGDSANGTITVSDPTPDEPENTSDDDDMESTTNGSESTDTGENADPDDSGSTTDDGPINIDIDLRLGVGALLTLVSGIGLVVWRRR